MVLSVLPSPARLPKNLVHIFGAGHTADGIDFALVGGIIGLVSGIIGFVVGMVGLVSGILGVVGGIPGVAASGLLGVVAGGVLGVVVGGAVGPGIFLRDWNFRRSLSIPVSCAAGHDASPAASNATTTASWRIMRLASGLMPRAAGRRWLAEAVSCLTEAPAEYQRRAARNYLVTAPQVIAVTWTSALTRRTQPTGSEPTDRQSNGSGEPHNF
jgi:hypothetical protein